MQVPAEYAAVVFAPHMLQVEEEYVRKLKIAKGRAVRLAKVSTRMVQGRQPFILALSGRLPSREFVL